MKTESSLSIYVWMTMVLFQLSSCQQWGEWDPPAANMVYPKLELIATYAFDSWEETDAELFAYEGGDIPEIRFDEEHGSMLNTNGGYVRLPNPLTAATLQAGASLTFWLKPSAQDESGTLFSFASGDLSSALTFAGNGDVTFQAPGSSFVSPSGNSLSGLLTADEWHYLAVVFNINGYSIYVDGESIVGHEPADFDFTLIRDFLMEAPHLYLAYGNSNPPGEFCLNDLKVYRNVVTEKEIAVPAVKPPGEDIPYEFPPIHTVGYYLLDNTFENSINPAQSGELITVEAQSDPSAFVEDDVRGTVWKQQEGWGGHENGWAYTRFANPLRNIKLTNDGFTLSLWLNPPRINWWDQIFVLNDGTSKFWINSIAYVGYNGAGGWFDCHNNNNTHELPAGKWTMLTLVMTVDEFTVYYNGEVKFTNTNNGGYATGEGFAGDYQVVMDLFTSAIYFYFGYETFWRAAPALIDDLFLISRPISASEVKFLYQDTQK